MMRNTTEIGMNRTGIGVSPVQSKELIAAALSAEPSSAGNEEDLARARAAYADDAEPLGSVPPPTTVRGAVRAVGKLLQGESMTVLLDKLGERLAFERTGSRLYEALITKFKVSDRLPGGPTLDELELIHDQEAAHFEMLRAAIASLGGDPTVLTPSADVTAVISMGLPQVLNDPRTTLTQCLEAILVAELADNEGWSSLCELAERMGNTKLAEQMRVALGEEEVHLARVRAWVAEATLIEGAPGKRDDRDGEFVVE